MANVIVETPEMDGILLQENRGDTYYPIGSTCARM